ncbi:MAG: hypothetical protein DMF88_10725 [Acidobacteria bacterium]|nr:MAG: hypothetical protein DMF88_10725 [Acidobacteriota bacterium]
MTEEELRALVRQAIARVRTHGSAGRVLVDPPDRPALHASHAMFQVTSGADEAGPCIIEPAVPCNHCGYCKSLGH